MYLEKMFGLKGKVAVITGANAGIGQVIAVGMAQAGATIINFSRTGAEETIKKITDVGGKCFSYKVDVTNELEVESALGKVVEEHKSIDVLFNNAGVCIHQDTFDTSLKDWNTVIGINLTGVFIMAKAVGKIMVDMGVRGSIINMASMSGTAVNVPQWQASYNASKAGVIHLSKSLAVEWADYGIRVNSISPGYISTAMSIDTPQELRDAWMPLIPQQRMGKPEEIIPTILCLASDSSGYTTGSDIIIDGGYSAR